MTSTAGLGLLLPLLLPAVHPSSGEPDPPIDGVFVLEDVTLWRWQRDAVESAWLLVDGNTVRLVEPTAVPAGARHLRAEEGESWWAYPGMIHADLKADLLSEFDSAYRSTTTDTERGPAVRMEWGERGALRAHRFVADLLDWDASAGESWREFGFVAGQVLPQNGLLRGRTALIALDDEPLAESLLWRDGPQVLALRGAGGGYPRTAMSALATLRQAFADASWHLRAGARHPDPDFSALASSTVFLAHADSAREIENFLDLFRDEAPGQARLVILGGRDAWKHADRLKRQNVSVLYRMALQDPPKTPESVAPEAREPWRPPVALFAVQERDYAENALGFRRLLDAGVRCALVPPSTAKDWKKQVERFAEWGQLTNEEILVALADAGDFPFPEITGTDMRFGGADQNWSTADFIISRGPWDLSEPDLAWVFADGRAFGFPAKKREGESGKAADDDGSSGELHKPFVGSWEISIHSPRGDRPMSIAIDGDGSLMVDSPSGGGSMPADSATFSEGGLTFSFSPPEMGGSFIFTGTWDGDDLAGDATSPFGPLSWDGIRSRSGESDSEKGETSQEEPASSRDTGHPAWLVSDDADREPAHDLEGDVLLTGATLYPLDGTPPSIGDLLIRDGKIVSVGPAVERNGAIPTIDLTGMHIMPGILDAHSHLSLDSINEGAVAISAECRIGDMIRPESVSIYRAAAGGTAVAHALHGSANPIGGQDALWELDYRRSTQAELLYPDAPQGIKFALGENVKQSNGPNWDRRFPGSRPGVQAVYRRAFTAAQEYARQRASGGPDFRRDVRLEVLADILEHRIGIHCHSYRADELLMFLGICEQFGINALTFQHVLEGYKVAPELAAFGAMASTFSDWWAYKFEVIDAIPWNGSLMAEAGVTVSFNSDSNEMIRRLNTEAAKGVRYGGMSEEEALHLVTLNAAKQCRVDGQLGTLEVGKDGTVAVYDTHPLSTQARCVLTLARGRTLFELPGGWDERWDRYGRETAAFAAAKFEEPGAMWAPAADPESEAAWDRFTHNGAGLTFWIRNAVLHTMVPGEEPYRGDLWLQDGRIVALGRDAAGAALPKAPPNQVVEIDADGLHLYPGFINAGDTTGLREINAIRSSRDEEEIGDYQPDLSMASAIHADSRHLPVTRLTGTTSVLVTGRRGRITGQAALIHLDGTSTEEVVTVPDCALHIQFPGVKQPKAGKAPQPPKDLAELDRLLDRALAYGDRMRLLSDAGELPPERDLQLEALLPYARGEKRVLLETNGRLTLLAARNWATERNLRAILVGGRDAWAIAGLLGADRFPVIVGSVHTLPSQETDPYDAPFRNAGILAQAGVPLAFRVNDYETARNLPFQAATATAYGLGREATLHALTLGAAAMLGVDDFIGSLEVGKVADLFLCDGDPLEIRSQVRRMWIGGREVDLTSHQTDLRDRYRERNAQKQGR